MTTHNTGNPLGSTDVYDRYDNSENLDYFSNGPLDAYPDRFGVSRQSLQGIRNASQYVILGAYAAGLNFTARNQVFSYLGEFYAPGPSITLPYTTTGVGAGEIANFRSVGDAVLRSDLGNDSDPAKGAGIVAFDETLTYQAGSVGEQLKLGGSWVREPLAAAITTVRQMLSAQRVNIWEFASLVTNKPTPANPATWDWSPAVQGALDSFTARGLVEFPSGTFKFSGVSTSKTVSLSGQGAGVTVLQNFTAGATMLTYDQVGMADKDRRNWLTFEGLTVLDEASFTGIGIKTNNVLSVVFRDCYIRNFKAGFGLQILEALWVYLDRVNSDLCELNFVSTLIPHFNNVICINGGEFRNPTPGKSALYFEGGDVISVRDATIEGNSGGPGYVSGGKFRNIKMLTIDNTYFEVLSGASQGALVLDGCQAVRINGGQLNSQSTTVPSLLVIDSDAVRVSRASMVAFPIRTTGVCSVTLDGCLHEGPMDISVSTSFTEISPMPYNTRAVIVTNPFYQHRVAGKPRPFRNTYADSSFDSAAPGVTIVAGAPVSSLDASQGYYGPKSWRVTGVNGDSIRSASLGTTVADGQSGCMTFMAKADTAGRFTLTSFLAGAAGGHDIYLSTEWRRYFVITNLRPESTIGSTFLMQLAFQGTNAFNITDVQFVPFTDYGEIPGIVDGFNYLPTHGTAITGALSRTTFPEYVAFDRGINLRTLPTYADNAAATTGGVAVGDLYRTAVGSVNIRF